MLIANSKDVKKIINSLQEEWKEGVEKFIVKFGVTADLSALTLRFYVKLVNEELPRRTGLFATYESWATLEHVLETEGFVGSHSVGYKKVLK